MTPSRSPTALATISHMSKNPFCRNCWIGTSWLYLFLTRIFGANTSPAQSRVLGCVKRRFIWVERRYWRHGRCGKFVVATWPTPSFLLGMTSTSLAVQPCGTCVFQGIEIKSYYFQRPCTPEPLEYRDQTSWCIETNAVNPYAGSIESNFRMYSRYWVS